VGREELLLLVVHEQDVERSFELERVAQAADQARPAQSETAVGARGQLRPQLDLAYFDAGVAPDQRLIAQHHRLMAAGAQRVEHLDRRELGAAPRRRRHDRHDLHPLSRRA
jgi:hypothetical protein